MIHANQRSTAVYDSTAGHLEALRHGLAALARHRFGSRLGTAGPATQSAGTPLITENLYVQLAVETSMLGMCAVLAILLAVGTRRYRRRARGWSAPVLGSLVGISVTNAFVHGWADSSTALVFWTTAGLVVGEGQRRTAAAHRLPGGSGGGRARRGQP
jgi:hypothetical protein